MTDEEKVKILVRAIERADGTLEWTGKARNASEWAMTTVKRVRRILRAALKKAGASTCTDTVRSAPLADEGTPSTKATPGPDPARKG